MFLEELANVKMCMPDIKHIVHKWKWRHKNFMFPFEGFSAKCFHSKKKLQVAEEELSTESKLIVL